MSSKERIEKWNDTREFDELTPLEKWRVEVAKEVEKDRKREQKEEEEKERQKQLQVDDEEKRASWKPSVVTTSSMRSATKGLQRQLEASSRKLSSSFLSSFGIFRY